ncbi:MAG: hypothetical protein ACPGQS_02995 [Bradymonadia bacterium]
MKTLTNIITLALIASVTIACGASTHGQSSDTGAGSVALLSSVSVSHGTSAADRPDSEIGLSGVRVIAGSKQDSLRGPAIGGTAASTSMCPVGAGASIHGCNNASVFRLKRPTISHDAMMPGHADMPMGSMNF